MTRKETPMMRQYRSVKERYPDAIVFFRMGDFYEMFGEDARLAAPVLNVVLTTRDKRAEERIPMCGVPYHAADTYIAKLIEKNFKVAVCEQVEDPKAAKGIVRREIVRVITPGTVLEDNLLQAVSNNYLASLARWKDRGGVAFLDLSTGEFQVTELRGGDVERGMLEELSAWSPREVIMPEDWRMLPEEGEAVRISRIDGWVYSLDYTSDQLKSHFGVTALDGFGLTDAPAAVLAAGSLMHYVHDMKLDGLSHVSRLRFYHNSRYVYLDSSTRRNLELTRTLMGGERSGSLLSYIDTTVTPMGGRLLKKRLEMPLRARDALERRLDQVDVFYREDELRRHIRNVLGDITDMERLMGRVATGTAHPRDLAALRSSLARLPDVFSILNETGRPVLKDMMRKMDVLSDVLELLRKALADDPPATIREGNIIRSGYHRELDEIRAAAREGKQWIAQLQARERERTGIGSLKIRFNKVFGYYIEVTRANLDKVPEDYIRRQTMVNAERFVTPGLKEVEEKILGAEERMKALEVRLFRELRELVAREVERVQATARTIAEIDVAAGLAELAATYRYRRPVLEENDTVIRIEGGRHPVVERLAGVEGFVPNDVYLDGDAHRLLILTGPNMAGKSTYIRQVALIVLLAQIGSFVPADKAHIGLVDRIFTRVGASDNLAGGQSTFMVEMSEAANILNNASERSLVILDEIGRGTSTFDGLSIAWAVAEYLHERKIRTMFATHYHELTDLEERLEGVRNFNVMVKEWNDRVIFLRKVAPGGVDRSYGIQVARLAGLPEIVLQRAREVLTALELKEKSRVPDLQRNDRSGPKQLELFQSAPSPVEEALRRTDIERLTPLEALNLLAEWKEKYGR